MQKELAGHCSKRPEIISDATRELLVGLGLMTQAYKLHATPAL